MRSSPSPGVPIEALVSEARGSARRHASDDSALVELALARVDAFFEGRSRRIDPFLAELFGWRGKWRAAFWGEGDYGGWVRRRFEREVLCALDFEREALGPVQDDYVHAWTVQENRMLVEVHGLLRERARAPRFDSFATMYAGLAGELAALARQDGALNVVSITGAELAALAVTSALASAGAFGTSVAVGAANSWWSFGISIAVGLITGLVIDALLGDACEDRARVRIREELDRLRETVRLNVTTALRAAWTEQALRQETAAARAVERSLGHDAR